MRFTVRFRVVFPALETFLRLKQIAFAFAAHVHHEDPVENEDQERKEVEVKRDVQCSQN
jgi:hypothetical protein